MDKRLLAIGIILVLLGLLSAYESGQQFLSGISAPNNTVSTEFYINATETAYQPMPLNYTGFLEVGYNSSVPLDFYIVNASEFALMEDNLGSTAQLKGDAESSVGNGTFYITINSTTGLFPYSQAYVGYLPEPAYSVENNNIVLQPGTYYGVFRNYGSTEALVLYTFFSKPVVSESLTNSSIFGFGLVSALLVLVGFALTVYGIVVKRDAGAKARVKEENVEKIYERMPTRRSKKTRKHKTERKKSRSR